MIVLQVSKVIIFEESDKVEQDSIGKVMKLLLTILDKQFKEGLIKGIQSVDKKIVINDFRAYDAQIKEQRVIGRKKKILQVHFAIKKAVWKDLV